MKESKASAVDGQVYATFAFVEDRIWFGGKCRPGLRSSLHVNAQEEVENSSWENLSIEAGLASLKCMSGMAELPSVENFICILQKCRKKKSLEFATSMHVHVCNSGLEAHRALGNFLIPMFVECGSMAAAQQVFSRLVHRNEHSWTSLIQGNIECGESQHGLNLYQKMQEDCVPPSRHTLVALLKACTKLKCLERGQDILAEVVKQGWESDKFVGNTLVDMYAKCGALAEAQTVFDKLLLRDVVSWTALITGYAERGRGDEALSFFNQMQVEGVSPDAVTFVCCLKVCGSIGAIDKGREVHAEIAREGFERDVSIGNTLVDMYAKCGLVKEAREVFDELLHRDVVSWNVLITGYAEHGLGVEALKCLEQMQLEGVSQDDVTYVGSLKACGSTGAINRGRELHAEIAKGKYKNDPVVGNTLVDMYAKCGLFAEAREVLDELQARDVISWNALIAGYAEHGLGEAALDCLEYMESEGASPNAISIICSLKACGSIAALDRGLELHHHVIIKGFERDPSVANTLLDMYAKCGSLAEAQEMFDTLPVRDVVSWTALIAGFAEHKLVDEALNSLKQMQTDAVSFNALTFACSLKACGSAGALAKGQELHTEIMKEGFESVTLAGNALVDMYFKCGSIAEAQEVFDELPVRDVISWTALLTGYAEHELGEEALNLLEQMQSDGVFPNIVTYVSSLKACSSLGAIGKCQELHTRVVQLGLERDSFVGNTLVDTYAKCGRLAEAQEVFNKLPAQDVVLWNALIAGHTEHGLDKEALKCWDQIQTKGIPPNAITFICSLKACASLGAMARGREIHNEIAKKNLEGEPFVGNTLVDLYAKCGSLAEAQTVFDKLPVQDLVSWTALIAGYAEHGLTEEAFNCLKQMQLEGMIPDDIAFVCCLKACGSTGALEKGQIIHAEIAREGFENELLVGSTLLDMYAKCGSLEEAKEVFSQLPVQDVVLWNALIAGYVDSGHSVHALNLLKGLQSEGLSPNDVTLVCWLKACASTGNINQGKEMHLEVVKKGFEKDCFVYNALICMYCKCGSLAEAQKVFDEILVYDEVSWNALLSGYAEHGLVEEALSCLEQMQLEGVPPNVISWSATILGCAEQGENKKAFLLFGQMQEQGLLPNSVTFLNLLKACSKAADIETGKMIHALIFRLDGLEESVATTLVDMYGKCGCMVDAHQVFDATASRDLAGWNSLITGYARQGESELVFSLFERMREEGVRPDDVTFLTVLTVCSHAGLVEKGLEYFESMILEYAIPPNVKHQNCMVDLLSRAGQLNEAVLMLEKTPFQSDLAMWSIVLAACRKWGNVELGKHAFDCVVNLDENYATAFVMMSNIYADAHLMKEEKSFETFEVSS